MRSEVLRVRRALYVEAAFASGVRWPLGAASSRAPQLLRAGHRAGRSRVRHGRAGGVVARASSDSARFRPHPEWGSLISEGRNYPRHRLVDDHTARSRDRRGGALGSPHRPRRREARNPMSTTRSSPGGHRSARRVRLRAGYGRRRRRNRLHRRSRRSRCGGRRVGIRANRPPRTRFSDCCRGAAASPAASVDVRRGAHRRPSPNERGHDFAGARIGLVPQDPTTSLNPVVRVGDQVAEVLRIHGRADRRTAKIDALRILDEAGLDHPELRAGSTRRISPAGNGSGC